MIADGQDGSGVNNANFASPPEGLNPRMQMFLWNILDGRLTINNSAIAGNYILVNNGFTNGNVNAPMDPDSVQGNLVIAVDDNPNPDPNDICSALTNPSDLNGNIAIVRRGDEVGAFVIARRVGSTAWYIQERLSSR